MKENEIKCSVLNCLYNVSKNCVAGCIEVGSCCQGKVGKEEETLCCTFKKRG